MTTNPLLAPGLALDPVPRSITGPGRRAALVAASVPGRPGECRSGIRLQCGEASGETAFFDV